jgi:hypothetical protein
MSIIDDYKRGAKCSVNGNLYEQQIHNVLKFTLLNNKPFHTQNFKDLGGSTSGNDIECNFQKENDIGIEVKIATTPDWMQCSLKRNNNKWEGSEKGKIPENSRNEFNKLLGNIILFKNNIPPFFEKNITHQEWVDIKNATDIYDDIYISIPNDTINKLYLAKGCYYIQISNYGLYRLGEDICGFNVPLFKVEQKMRIRTKIHKRKNNKGYCVMSVIASCLPNDISTLEPSLYSLDSKESLPNNLLYNVIQ